MKNTVIAIRAHQPVSGARVATFAHAPRMRAICEFDCSLLARTATSCVVVEKRRSRCCAETQMAAPILERPCV